MLAFSTEEDRSPSQLYGINGSNLRRAVAGLRPVVAVVMKNVHHLRAMTKVISERLIPAVELAGRPFHLVVLDDEADDGSILDASAERTLDPHSTSLGKSLGQSSISGRPASHGTDGFPPSLCNLHRLHGDSASELSPIRPQPAGSEGFRHCTPNPLRSGRGQSSINHLSGTQWYRGFLHGWGDVLREAAGLPDLSNNTSNSSDDLREAIRAFLVAGAIRIWRNSDRLRPSEAQNVRFEGRSEAAVGSPRPHSMPSILLRLFRTISLRRQVFSRSLATWIGPLACSTSQVVNAVCPSKP